MNAREELRAAVRLRDACSWLVKTHETRHIAKKAYNQSKGLLRDILAEVDGDE